MCQTARDAHVRHDEEDAHGDRRDGEKLAEQHDLLDGLEVVDVGRTTSSTAAARHHEKVKSRCRTPRKPGPAMPSMIRPRSSVIEVGQEPYHHQDAERPQPDLVRPAADQDLPDSDQEVLDHGASLPVLSPIGEEIVEFRVRIQFFFKPNTRLCSCVPDLALRIEQVSRTCAPRPGMPPTQAG